MLQPVRGCLYEKKLIPLSGISRSSGSWWHRKSFLFSFCVYMIKRAGSLTEILPLRGKILVSRMNRNPYKHFSLPAKINFNRGAHAYDVWIQTIMVSIKSITRHHWTTEQEMEAAATAKETTSNLQRKNFRWNNDMLQHLINSLLENKQLMAYKNLDFDPKSLCNIRNYE